MTSGLLKPSAWLGQSSEPCLFTVPVYQRLFTWGEEQFDRLLDDLGNANAQPHYLGIITVVKHSKEGSFVLIDGQQRLTAIAILTSLLTKDGNGLKIEERLHYEARPDDTEALKIIWKNGKDWMNESCADKLEYMLDASGLSNDNMKMLIRAVWRRIRNGQCLNINKLRLLVAELPEEYAKNTNLQNEYFEKMNSSGKQLEQHEVLKVRICANNNADYKRWNAIENFGKAYENALGASGNDGNDDAVSLFEAATVNDTADSKETEYNDAPEKWSASLIDFPCFLRHVYALHQNDGNLDIQTPLLKLFANKPVDGFLEKMAEYREYLDRWIIHVAVNEGKFEDEQEFAYWSGAKEEKFAPVAEEKKALFKQLQMTLFALEGNRQDWMLKMFLECKEDANAYVGWLVRYLIKKCFFVPEKLKGDVWPDEYLTYDSRPRTQLACLDFFLWALWRSTDELKDAVFGNLKEKEDEIKAIEDYVPRSYRSVEHFHPRKDVNSSNLEKWKKDTATNFCPKNLFGNLALISAGENSKYSNLGVAGKSERIDGLVQKRAIESIKLLLMRAECQGKDEYWTPEKARKHATTMLMVLKWGIRKWAVDGVTDSPFSAILSSSS